MAVSQSEPIPTGKAAENARVTPDHGHPKPRGWECRPGCRPGPANAGERLGMHNGPRSVGMSLFPRDEDRRRETDRRGRAGWRRRDGQAAVLAALSLFSMVVFLAMATNFGIAVNERIRVQNTADLAAYAGAYTQAKKLNDIALLNRAIMEVARYCRLRLTLRTEPVFGLRTWNKVWDQNLPEGPSPFIVSYIPSLPVPPALNAKPPLHALKDLPPNADTPPEINAPGASYPPSDDCYVDYDRRADDLINWCERTMNYYAAIIYDINDYDSAYLGARMPSLGPPQSILKAVTTTARANYPLARVEMLDYPENSPVKKGRFMQTMVAAESPLDSYVDPVQGYVDEYERPGGPSMAPLNRYYMRFNYVYHCGNALSQKCSEACRHGGQMMPRNVGHHYSHLGFAYRTIGTMYYWPESGPNSGILYMPVRTVGDPRLHAVPLLDNPSKNPKNNYYGGWGTWDELMATAVAKPFDGFVNPNLGMMEGDYELNYEEPVVMPRAFNGVYTASDIVDMMDAYDYPEPGPGAMSIRHFNTYRARMAGFREPLDTAGSGTMLQVLVEHMATHAPAQWGNTTH